MRAVSGAMVRKSLRSAWREISASAPASSTPVGPAVLAAYPDHLRAFARTALERLGVSVWTGSPVSAISPGRLRVGDETIDAGTILWAAGISASPLGSTLGTERDRAGRVVVNEDLSVAEHPEIFVVGDLAALNGADGKQLPGVIQVALQQADCAAANILRTLKNESRMPFSYHDLGNMATIGRNSAVCDLGWIRLKGVTAWLAWVFLHVYKLIGFRNRLSVMTQWAFSYLTYQRSVRLITHERAADSE